MARRPGKAGRSLSWNDLDEPSPHQESEVKGKEGPNKPTVHINASKECSEQVGGIAQQTKGFDQSSAKPLP